MEMLEVKLTDEELTRLFNKILIDDTTGCWEWCGAKIKNRGYGAFNFRGKTEMVHRLMFANYAKPIPKGMKDGVLDHVVCNNRACCNPAHLILTTQGRNSLRGGSPPALNKRKTHCIRGHKLPDEPNEAWGTNRIGRRCIPCRKMNASRRYKERHSI